MLGALIDAPELGGAICMPGEGTEDFAGAIGRM